MPKKLLSQRLDSVFLFLLWNYRYHTEPILSFDLGLYKFKFYETFFDAFLFCS